jgi:hypothetical protein
VVQEPLPQERVWVEPWAALAPPPMLKLMVLITRSRCSEPHLEQTISIWSWLLLTISSVTSLHFKHLNSYMGIMISFSYPWMAAPQNVPPETACGINTV